MVLRCIFFQGMWFYLVISTCTTIPSCWKDLGLCGYMLWWKKNDSQGRPKPCFVSFRAKKNSVWNWVWTSHTFSLYFQYLKKKLRFCKLQFLEKNYPMISSVSLCYLSCKVLKFPIFGSVIQGCLFRSSLNMFTIEDLFDKYLWRCSIITL